MGTIEEVMEDVKDTVGNKGFLILIAGVVILFIYNLSKGSNSETVNVTALSSYPDTVTNANVIIDTLQQSIDYSEGQIKDEIQGLDSGLKEYLEKNFTATNDFINTGIESNQILMNKNFEEIMGGLDNNSSNISSLETIINQMKNELNKKPATTTTTTTPTTQAKPTTPTVSYYQYQTKAGYNTNTSLVDALKVIGVDSSMANRTKIAQANGISNYTGTYSQNVTLLQKLKSGQLIRI